MFGTQPLTPNSAGITGPMNINAVIAHLVEMTPQQRKQFAQMHMDDPMMLSAAKFVDNQISKQAAAIASQTTGVAPPPVNQQVVAQMAPQPKAQPMPEESGIANLPAQNMPSEYAAGGIVAFDGGGPVNGVYVPNSNVPPGALIFGNRWRDPETGKEGYLPGQGPSRTGYEGMTLSDLATKTKEAIEDLFITGAANKKRLAERRESVAAAAPDYHPESQYTGKAYGNAPPTPSAATGAGAGQGTRGTPAAPPEKGAGIEQLRRDKDNTTTAPSARAQTTSAETAPDYGTMYANILKAQPDARASLPKEIGEIEALEKEQGNRELASVGKREQGLQSLMTKREARLAKRESALSQQEDLNPYMAMINAGLSMMQSTGKGLAGIAAGAEKGMGQYAEGVKLNTAQRQKIDDARDALDDLRYNQETMTEKERNEAYNRIKQGAVATRTATVNFIQHRDDVNARTAGHIFDATAQQALEGRRQQFQAQENALERQSRAAAAEKAADRLPGEVRAAQLLGNGNYEAGLRKMADIQAGKFNPMNAYIQYYLPAVAKDPTAQPKSFDQFKAMLGIDVIRP